MEGIILIVGIAVSYYLDGYYGSIPIRFMVLRLEGSESVFDRS